MRHLKAFDPARTVIIVQVENETGTWGTAARLLAGCAKGLRGSGPADVLKAMNKRGPLARTGRRLRRRRPK